jgi:hypothetical protein
LPTSTAAVFVLAVAAFAARLPLLTRPLSPDEGGFLMVAGQWAPGTSLYGDYWVDRPPLLVGLFQLAGLLGGSAAILRLLGAVFVASSVLLAAALARVAVRLGDRPPERPAVVPIFAAATSAAFLVSPLFGASEVDGELLAVPFVLAGLTAAFTAYAARARQSFLWWTAAGVLGVAAASVKQNMLEVFVAATVLLVAVPSTAPPRRSCGTPSSPSGWKRQQPSRGLRPPPPTAEPSVSPERSWAAARSGWWWSR